MAKQSTAQGSATLSLRACRFGMCSFVCDVVCRGVELPPLQQMQYTDAMRDYGIDKPDLRFGMLLKDLTELTQVCALGIVV